MAPSLPPTEADVVIIGAGIVGASCFYQLSTAGRGLRVVCFDRSHKLHGSTARSAAAFRHQFSAAVNVRASLLSSAAYAEFPARFGTEPVIRRNGYCFAYTDGDAFEAARLRATRQADLGVPDLEVLEPHAVRGRFPMLAPDGLAGATFCRHDGFVVPDRIANCYFEAGQAVGGCLRQYAGVVGIEREAGRVTGVALESGHTCRAPVVVNAAGPWAPEVARLAGLEIPVVPVKRYLYFTRQLTGRDVRSYPLFVLDLEAYCRPELNGLMLGWDKRPNKPMGWNRFPPPQTPPLESDKIEIGMGIGLDEYGIEVLGEIARYLPFLEDEGGLAAVTSGYYEVSPDEKAIVAFDPRLAGFLHATGFSGHGVMHAPATGMLVRALVLDEEPPLSAAALALAPLLENHEREDPEAMVI